MCCQCLDLFVFKPLIVFKTSLVVISKFDNVCSNLVNGTLPVSSLASESLISSEITVLCRGSED